MQIFIHRILDSKALWIVARVLLVVIFLSSGLAKLIDFEGGLAEMRSAGLHPPIFFNIATIITLLTGSFLILMNRCVWLASGALSIFMLLTILIVHTFWHNPVEGFEVALFFALEHVTVVGGLIMATIVSRMKEKEQGLK
ncbi:DoxX family protein [Wohlfahrtiimonas larvae]|uniref:Multidrug efflux RND transporter inhibitory subunit MexG n=1 Tax=Wohlfahrtiimonas larvae TaxID=1157986 RepID=A0ABP9MSG1_9GAMM|nr:DoxX family protein [Wohlfahrtiimonas larvae]